MNLFYRGGCFLPFLIIFNFFFGWIFFGLRAWILIEIILIIILMIYPYILSRKIMSGVNSAGKRRNAIDVEGKVIK
jgi:antibiotic biosynthesis monooxygenase (ABM) superfamily enzyme